MDVDLNLKSVGLQIPHMDESLAKLQKVHDLISTMGRSVKVDLQITGAGALTTTIDQMNKLAAGLRLVGMHSAAAGLQSGQLTTGETSRISQAVKARLDAEEQAYKTAKSRYVQHKTSWDALNEKGKSLNLTNAEANLLPEVLNKINREAALMDRAFSNMNMLRQVHGLSEALKGVDFSAPADANKGMAASATAAAAAMNVETAAAEKQAVAMEKVAVATKKAAKAKKEAVPIENSGTGTLLARRVTTTADGDTETLTYRTGLGGTRKYLGTSEVKDSNELAKFRERAAAIGRPTSVAARTATSLWFSRDVPLSR